MQVRGGVGLSRGVSRRATVPPPLFNSITPEFYNYLKYSDSMGGWGGVPGGVILKILFNVSKRADLRFYARIILRT